MKMMRTVGAWALAGALISPSALVAQGGSVGLLPWMGCWAPEADAEETVCVRPEADGLSATLLRIRQDQIVAREVIWADGRRHETRRDECDGWEEGRVSSDGRRVFLTAEYRCEDGSLRRGSGIMSFTSDHEWLDVRSLAVGEEPVAWVQRYRPAGGDALDIAGVREPMARNERVLYAARRLAAAGVDVDDVIEAVSQLPAEVVTAWVAERGEQFRLDGASLLRMADAGVPDEVVDVVVAVSHPRTFALSTGPRRRPSRGGGEPLTGRRGYATMGWGGPFFWDPWYAPGFLYDPFSYGYRYGYGYGYGGLLGYPFSGYGYGYPYVGYRPTVVEVDRTPRGSYHGRVVNGAGYRGPGAGRSGGQARPARASDAGYRGPSASSGRSGSSSSSGRTAKRRGGRF